MKLINQSVVKIQQRMGVIRLRNAWSCRVFLSQKISDYSVVALRLGLHILNGKERHRIKQYL